MENTVARVKIRKKMLKAITGSTWGKAKETLLDSYKAMGHPFIDYAVPVWAPGINDTLMTRVQPLQNQALCTVNGCHSMTAESHLQDECKILTVRDHCTLLIRQHLINCKDSCHPNHGNTWSENTDRARQVRCGLSHFLNS